MNKKLKIVFLAVNDKKGGAAIALDRIFKEFKKKDYENFLDCFRIVAIKFGNDDSTFPTYENNIINRLRMAFFRRIGRRDIEKKKFNSIVKKNIIKKIEQIDPNIINVHNIHGFTEIPDIIEILASKWPVVWTMHDMWSFTGHCSSQLECLQYKDGCNHSCPIPNAYPAMEPERINECWRYREKLFNRFPGIVGIAPSNWLRAKAKEGLWKNNQIEVIHNGIDVELFKPIKKEDARKSLNIPTNRKYILCGAVGLTREIKGWPYFVKSLEQIFHKNTAVLLFGNEEVCVDSTLKKKLEIINLGKIEDINKLVNVYCAADIFVLPSLIETLPTTAIEALACGTPVIAFKIAGIPEIVKHMRNGYLANYKDENDLAYGINLVLNDKDLYQNFRNNGIRDIQKYFNIKNTAKDYFRLFKNY